MAAFIPRLTAPAENDAYWISTGKGGLNECIVRNSATGSVLPNCVGYAWGRFYEITGKRPKLSRNNAEVWYTYTADGYSRGKTPKLGAVICWEGLGSLAGHVAVVEQILSNGDIVTSNSNYSGTRWYLRTYTKASNYGITSSYRFQGFIYPPDAYDNPTDPVGTPVERDTTRDQVEVLIGNLRGRKRPELGGETVQGFARPGVYNVLSTLDMTGEASNGYLWYRVEQELWVAAKEGEWTRYLPAVTPDDKDRRIAELEAEIERIKRLVKDAAESLDGV